MAVQSVLQTDSLDTGRDKWNANDLELEQAIIALQGADTTTEGLISALQATDSAYDLVHNTLENLINTNSSLISILQQDMPIVMAIFTVDASHSLPAWGWDFELNSFLGSKELRPGTVEVSVNGLEYFSPESQIDYISESDFHINSTTVFFHDIAHNGTLDLINGDIVTIKFQKM